MQPSLAALAGLFACPTLALAAPQTTHVYVDHVGTQDPLVQTCIPIAPTSGALPDYWIDGRRADVLPVSWTGANEVDWVQVIAPSLGRVDANGDGFAELSATGTTLLPPPSYSTVDLATITIKMDTGIPGVDVVSAPLIGALQVVHRDGRYINEVEYFSQFTGNGVSNPLAGVRSFVTCRSDVGTIEVQLILTNDIFDPTTGELYTTNSTVDGDIHFQKMWIDLGTSGARIVAETDSAGNLVQDDSQDLEAGILVSEAPRGRVHYWPARMCFMRHFGLRFGESLAAARSVVNMHGYGYADDGPNSVHSRRGFGAQRDFVPKFGGSYKFENHAGQGYEAVLDMSRFEYAQLSEAIRFGGGANDQGVETSNDFFETGQLQGFWFPGGKEGSSAGGPVGVLLRDGYHFCREEWLMRRQMVSYLLQRHGSGLTHPSGGDVTEMDLVAANSFAPGLYPWAWNNENRIEDRNAHFIGSDDNDCVPVPLKPATFPWNRARGDQPLEPESASLHDMNGTFGTHPSTHLVRFTSQLQGLAWGANSGVAKYLMRREAAAVERLVPRTPADHGGQFTAFPRFESNKSAFHLAGIQDALTNAGRTVQAGHTVNGVYIGWERGEGHTFNAYAEGARVTPPSPRRTEMLLWAEEALRAADSVLSLTGASARLGPPAGDGNHPSNPAGWGCPDEVARNGAVPPYYATAQSYMSSYLSWGLLGLYESLNPNIVAPYTSEATVGVRTMHTLALERWSNADRLGQDKASSYVIAATYDATFMDACNPPPDVNAAEAATILPEWYFIEPPAGTFSCANLCGSGTMGPYTSAPSTSVSRANQRDMPHLYTAYRIQDGTSFAGLPGAPSDADKFLLFAQRLIGDPPSGSLSQQELEAFSDRLQELMSSDADTATSYTRRLGSTYASLLGEVQSRIL